MTTFIEQAIERAGLSPVLAQRRSGDLEAVRASVASWGAADLLVVGAIADALRAEDVGDVVRIHERAPHATATEDAAVTWVDAAAHASELEFLRAVAVARITADPGARIGVDWSTSGLELAQVALGFGACELRGPITRKSGLPIASGEQLKVKGRGLVELRSIKKQEIGALVTHAGRRPIFDDDEPAPHEGPPARESNREVARA